MKIRVAEYIADYLAQKGIKDVFTVVGGGAMYLNNAFGTHADIRCTYTHHEQAAAIAAESYAKASGRIATVCVTTGPGGTNALTGVLCGYQDNVPMLIISGQVRYATTVESTGLELRQMGEQEYYIIRSVKPMTKYAEMVKNPNSIKKMLDEAIYIAYDGRKGPCWLDIPLDVQGAMIETEELEEFDIPSKEKYDSRISEVRKLLAVSERPVILAGSGIRGSDNIFAFKALVKSLHIPVVCATTIADLYPDEDESYFGNFGVFGGRPGNFIVQNADLIISMGCRMTYKQIGFNYELFAKQAKKIVVDVDAEELKKDLLHIDLPIFCDLSQFIQDMVHMDLVPTERSNWWNYCSFLKRKYPIYLSKYELSEKVNPYYLKKQVDKQLSPEEVMVVGNSVACVSVLQMGIEKEGQRLYGNVNCGTMGYDLPAAIGAARATNKEVVCFTGDGSIQMNLQELQTIIHNNLPIKIIIFNNFGYQAIVQSQTNFFNGHFSGCTKESGLSMPSFEKLAAAYGFPFIKIEQNKDVSKKVQDLFSIPGFAICELIQDELQIIEPKVKSKQLEDGTLYSPPIDDLSPFLTDGEYQECQYSEKHQYK